MFSCNIPIVVVRDTDSGESRVDMKPIVDTEVIFFRSTPTSRRGTGSSRLPSGKTRTIHITKVAVLQSPFGSHDLDHTEAHFATTAPQRITTPMTTTFHVQATNVQIATGDRSHQTMTIGQTADHLVLLINRVAELLQATGVAHDDAELNELREAAIADVTSDRPDAKAVRRFHEWVIDCTKKAGTAATVTAMTAAATGLLQDAEALVRATGH